MNVTLPVMLTALASNSLGITESAHMRNGERQKQKWDRAITAPLREASKG